MQMAEKEKDRKVRLTPRDIETLRFIGEQYAVRLDVLQRLLGRDPGPGIETPGQVSESAARVWLRRMKAIGAIDHQVIYYGERGYVWLLPYGLQLADLDFKPLVPKPSTLHHLFWCAVARLDVEKRHPEWQWRSERYLRSEHAKEHTPKKGLLALDVPDAEVTTARGTIAIEVELSEKQPARLDAILRRRASYYTTFYFCTTDVRGIVEASKARLGEIAKRIQVYDLAQLEP